jgi:hypothetical protein
LRIKDLWRRSVGEKVMAWDERIFEELEGLPGGPAWAGKAGENRADLTQQL